MGCSECITPDDLIKERSSIRNTAIQECNRKALHYVTHYKDVEDWSVMCYQENPLKFYEYSIKWLEGLQVLKERLCM